MIKSAATTNTITVLTPLLFKTPGFDKYRTAWKLRNMQMFEKPLPYATRNGAVSWINLSPEEAAEVIARTKALSNAEPAKQQTRFEPTLTTDTLMTPNRKPAISEKTASDAVTAPKPAPATELPPNSTAMPRAYANLSVPIAKDGTVFSPQLCNKKGTYQVGPKGEEVKFNSFVEALTYLTKLPTARWRRPNTKGNWGIVTAKDWVKLSGHWQ